MFVMSDEKVLIKSQVNMLQTYTASLAFKMKEPKCQVMVSTGYFNTDQVIGRYNLFA